MSEEPDVYGRGALREGARTMGIELSEAQVDVLLRYLALLDETNQHLNLTRIPSGDYVLLHVLDSLTSLLVTKDLSGKRVLDVGTGAGFPGVPIAVAEPRASVVLLDSTAKKLRFIEDSVRKCGIANCSFLHLRAEAAGRMPEHRDLYDVVVSRAVAPYRQLIELLMPLVRVGGRAVAMKGAGLDREMEGTEPLVDELGAVVEEVRSVTLPGSDIARHLVVLIKRRATPRTIPHRLSRIARARRP